MAQNIYDNAEFLARYSQLPRQVHGLAGAPEWPMMRAMLPALCGKRVVDLGCGMGAASRFLSAEGAASVLGLDLSSTMLARAQAATSDPAITYVIADLEQLELAAHSFDLAFSILAFHYVADFNPPRNGDSPSPGTWRPTDILDRASDFHGGGATALDPGCGWPQDLAGQCVCP